MSKHTPGPWDRRWTHTTRCGEDGVSTEESGRIVGPDGDTIAHLAMDARVDANAALIASAPDLLIERDNLAAQLANLRVEVMALREENQRMAKQLEKAGESRDLVAK